MTLFKIVMSALLLSPFILFSCAGSNKSTLSERTEVKTEAANLIFDGKEISKTDEEWKTILGPESYEVLRKKGTERAFTAKEMLENKKKGHFYCAGCGLPLFSSNTKFDSGTGWPSFYQPVAKENVGEITDESHGMIRTEVVCNRCGGHLGHVFDDGPKPTGLRYCMNGVSMKFVESK